MHNVIGIAHVSINSIVARGLQRILVVHRGVGHRRTTLKDVDYDCALHHGGGTQNALGILEFQ